MVAVVILHFKLVLGNFLLGVMCSFSRVVLAGHPLGMFSSALPTRALMGAREILLFALGVATLNHLGQFSCPLAVPTLPRLEVSMSMSACLVVKPLEKFHWHLVHRLRLALLVAISLFLLGMARVGVEQCRW
jgi:hypothetical protein